MTPMMTIASLGAGKHNAVDSFDYDQSCPLHHDYEETLKRILRDENAGEQTCSLPGIHPTFSMSEVEAQQLSQSKSRCAKIMSSHLFQSSKDHSEQLSRDNDLVCSHLSWLNNTTKMWKNSYQVVMWLVAIYLTITILTMNQTWRTCFRRSPHYQDSFAQAPVPNPDTPGRNITRYETGRSIHGTFTLYDSVTLSTTTGSIHATIDLVPLDSRFQAANNSEQPLRPATVDISTTAGSVHIGFTGQSRVNAYTRSLFITIKTQTGSMHATDILVGNGGITELTTDTGGMHPSFVVLGAGPYDPISHLITRTGSRSQHVTVRAFEGSSPEQAMLAGLRGDHRSTTSGSLHVTYPSTWEGKLESVTRAGKGHIHGRDMTCRSERDGLFGDRKTCYRLKHGDDGRNPVANLFLACETAGSVHFKA